MIPFKVEIISTVGIASIIAVVVLDLSQHTLILLYSALHGVGLGLIMFSLFMAMWIDSKPR